MRGIDTNVLVRFLTGDDPAHAARARAIVEGADVFVSATVLLETEWVLRSVYDFPGRRVIGALRAFCGLPRVAVEAPGLVARAMDWAERGMDFADALHLSAAAGCEDFVSFDGKMAKAAGKVGALAVRAP